MENHHLGEALEQLATLAAGTDLLDDVTLLQSRHKRLEKRRHIDITPAAELNQEENRIGQAVLELFRELDNRRAA